jgi:hypothetical protein
MSSSLSSSSSAGAASSSAAAAAGASEAAGAAAANADGSARYALIYKISLYLQNKQEIKQMNFLSKKLE